MPPNKALVFVVLVLLTACGARPVTPAPVPTASVAPPTETPVPATAQVALPAATAVAPTKTPIPPAATVAPPTTTSVPPTATATPSTKAPVPPTAAAVASSKTTGPAKPTADPKSGIVRGRIKEGGVISLILFPEIDGSYEFTVSARSPQTKSSADGRFEFTNVPPGLYLLANDDPSGGYGFIGTTSKEELIVKHVIMANGPAIYEVTAGKTLDLGDLPAALKVR